MRTIFRALTGLGIGMVALAAAAGAQECLDCHDVEVTSPLHADFACSDCHFDVDLETHPDPPMELSTDAICAQCHGAPDEVAESVHADLSCTDCHGAAHEVISPAEIESPMSPLHQLEVCGSCHDDPEILDTYLESVHAKAILKTGLIEAPSCSDCHGAHEILPIGDGDSPLSHANVPETCGSCHAIILDRWETGSAHGTAWLAGEERGPVCTTCHASHGVREPTLPRQRLAFPERCGDCHGESLETFYDSFHGKATDLGFVTTAICSDCHTPHENLPPEDPRSSVHPENLRQTCGQCHGEVSASFASFDPHADPSDPERNRVVYVVYVFMTSLLIGVFGFFGLHDLLWLQRLTVGILRGEIERAPKKDTGPWVRRFRGSQIRLHVTIVLSFLLLAATGLPLKFHRAEWAEWLSSFFGGVAASGTIHRFAALVTFGYFFFHLGQIVRRGLVDKEPGIFWGWKSMVPRTKDVRDLWGNLRYFLYMGKQPKFDRWTYWEKFDYFAVFWGVVIIGASGLALWFPKIFTALFPGWWLNVAAVVHSDEALLAIGFIFVFHFFHTHLRPESFPLDTSIFIGSVPLERFKEERPEEYRRLVDKGELEKHLVPRPTDRQLRRAYLFGSAALTVGLLLVIGILVAVLGG